MKYTVERVSTKYTTVKEDSEITVEFRFIAARGLESRFKGNDWFQILPEQLAEFPPNELRVVADCLEGK